MKNMKYLNISTNKLSGSFPVGMKDFEKLVEFDVEKINKCVYRACAGIDGNNVSASEVILDAQLQLYDKITTKEIDEALILSARAKIEKEPN